MRSFTLICALVLFTGCFPMPIVYYSFLRLIITIGALWVVVQELQKEVNLLVVSFVIMVVLFNPIIPIYLHKKSMWLPLDSISGLLFLIFYFREKYKEQ